TRSLRDWSSDVCSSDLSLPRLLETGRALIGRIPQHGPDRTLIPSGLASTSANTRRGQPAGDGAERFPLFRVAAEDLAHDGGLVRSEEHTSELQSRRDLV